MGKGKAEVGTPKYLANKMKAKGLQKLRWYCQMCEKQCRDENGFKCHTMSESHQRQILLFADNAGRFIDGFSSEFLTGYIQILRRQFGSKRVAANKVYQEYISDRNHLHMNATKWHSLSDFVKYLGRNGHCVVDETDKGWFITYIDRDPETLAMQEKMAKKQKMDKDDAERLAEFIEEQVRRGKCEDEEKCSGYSELTRDNEEAAIKLDLKIGSKQQGPSMLPPKRPFDLLEIKKEKKEKLSITCESRKSSAIDELIKEEEKKKEKMNRKDYWLFEGIVVKLVTHSLGDKYYKEKGVVVEVVDKYRAKIKLLETGEKLKVDQAHLETVIPAVGKQVLILNGGYRGSTAILKAINTEHYSVTVEIASGPLKGRLVSNIAYEDISKMFI
ncbi:LOW QUALITY PROTEIN: DNA/RNA-binding protein KIN17 [Anopheles ziemanni]|uniref:LOW QUALITY PROTEIN: DNA/RNA-binding protein KIN17 n=1 Tax=Anopheles coustani TaxID=139045 RepID=UPI00265A46CE|nr:LOW QUALITY PROTEIN: DNA/RNA-binding protein KIN17 [Anopheles coustani]XP_058176959.1 LOW QUALITY PROTEIN: DNA/RNA-binding protein KIN17 [Anopheles ziemanni]